MHFRANGKVLLSAEYAVLHSARALAIPSKLGQHLSVIDMPGTHSILWESIDHRGQVWWNGNFPLELERYTSADPIALRVSQLLHLAKKNNPRFLASGCHVQVSTTFDLSWGLGSSSTLVSLIAQWAGVDPYGLQYHVFGGSGYDIACALATSPLVFTRWPEPCACPVGFHPPFANHLYLAILGQKQDSRKAIAAMPNRGIQEWEVTIGKLNQLTDAMLHCIDLSDFMAIMKRHEAIIGHAIDEVPIQESRFPGFPGQIKSLGAWGGDMVLAATHLSLPEVKTYFASKGINQVIPASQLLYFG